ncbi:MAG TPA: HlyD family type I secretion periplasmic adaptor subunit [Hyphomicrobiales bacterium]|jgi:HlyD family secretion protein
MTAVPAPDQFRPALRNGSRRTAADLRSGMRWRLATGVTLSLILMLTIFGWVAVAQLAGAVIASGVVVIENNSKKVQAPLGGVIGEILVKNGDHVAAGDLVIKLDDTQMQASLGIIRSQLAETLGRKARLVAERDAADRVQFPADLIEISAEAERVVEGEQRLFEARKISTEGQKAQLGERIKQNQEEIKGLEVQREAKIRESTLIREEVSRVSSLFQQNLLPVTRVIALQREEVRIGGEIGAFTAQIAKLGGQIAEGRMQISAIEQTKSSDAQKELRETEARIAELQERKIAAEDQLRRIDMRAPIDGIIHELSVHTIGGVVSLGEQLMLIVPSDAALSIEIHVPASEIDQVRIGQPTVLRFPAFNQRTTPEIKGTLTTLSPDISREQQTGQAYYTARITPAADAVAQLEGRKLIPGMPAEAFIETAPRTALSYLIKPLLDQFQRAFRER